MLILAAGPNRRDTAAAAAHIVGHGGVQQHELHDTIAAGVLPAPDVFCWADGVLVDAYCFEAAACLRRISGALTVTRSIAKLVGIVIRKATKALLGENPGANVA